MVYRNPNETMYAVYDLAIAPITFDFMHYAVMVEMARQVNGFKHVHFVFTLGPERSWRGMTPKDKALSDEEKMWRLKHILVPIAGMIPSYAGHSIYLDRVEAAKEVAGLIPQMIFPPNYHVNQPISMFMLSQVVEVHNQVKEKDITPVCLQPCPEAVRMAGLWCDQQSVDPSKMVAITVRQSNIEPDRNSNLKSWLRFVREITKEGWHPVILPDTEQAIVHNAGDLGDLKVYWPGAVNLDLRVGLYSLAKYNLSHNGGPAALNFFMPGSRYLQWVPVDALPKVIEGEGEAGQERLFGLKKGEDYEFSNGQKKYVWEKATFTNIYNTFSKFVKQNED